jgi:hypothetical protein
MKLAELLARQDSAAVDDPDASVLRSTVFEREDVVVRLVDLREGGDAEPLPRDAGQAAEVRELLAGEAARMALITDRRSPGA